jgi:ABC-type glutathione transport system ATPase component
MTLAGRAASATKGFVEVKDFALSYDTLDGAVEAVTGVSIHVDPGEFVSIIGPSGLRKIDPAQRGRRFPQAHRRHRHGRW